MNKRIRRNGGKFRGMDVLFLSVSGWRYTANDGSGNSGTATVTITSELVATAGHWQMRTGHAGVTLEGYDRSRGCYCETVRCRVT